MSEGKKRQWWGNLGGRWWCSWCPVTEGGVGLVAWGWRDAGWWVSRDGFACENCSHLLCPGEWWGEYWRDSVAGITASNYSEQNSPWFPSSLPVPFFFFHSYFLFSVIRLSARTQLFIFGMHLFPFPFALCCFFRLFRCYFLFSVIYHKSCCSFV